MTTPRTGPRRLPKGQSRESTVAFLRLDGQTAADTAEAIAFNVARIGQQPGNTLAQRWNRAGTAGEKHRIDVFVLQPALTSN